MIYQCLSILNPYVWSLQPRSQQGRIPDWQSLLGDVLGARKHCGVSHWAFCYSCGNELPASDLVWHPDDQRSLWLPVWNMHGQRGEERWWKYLKRNNENHYQVTVWPEPNFLQQPFNVRAIFVPSDLLFLPTGDLSPCLMPPAGWMVFLRCIRMKNFLVKGFDFL